MMIMHTIRDKKLADVSDCKYAKENEYCIECYTELYYYMKSS